jgi:catalase
MLMALSFATLSATARADSSLPAGVQLVTPTESKSITDPSQLAERTPGHLVEDLHAAFGAHHMRAVHTKGFILTGSFQPDAGAIAFTRADLFNASVPMVVRFSDFTGLPAIPDTNPNGQPRGLGVKFLMPDGSNFDLVTHSYNGFPTKTAADFGDLLEAIAASGPGAAKPTPIEIYLAGHPAARHFLTTQTPPPESWATTTYFGVNAFEFSNAAHSSTYVRFRLVPGAGEHYLDAATLTGKSPDYLREEISARVARQPITFTWYAQLAQKGDDLADPSTPWPESRKLVKLGVLTIDKVGPNTALADRSLSFMPGTMLPGVGIADPMLAIRNAAYPLSFSERQ